jgi:neogenin
VTSLKPSLGTLDPGLKMREHLLDNAYLNRLEDNADHCCNVKKNHLQIPGYKLRWRKHGRGKSEVVTTDGSRRLYAISSLVRGADYQVKISALTVNGSGPATTWIEETTFATDLDETAVPDPPSSLRARAMDEEITIMWTPPADNRILLRGYKIGWGRGIPDEYFKLVDDNQRMFVIPDLRPNSEYIITLRAYNNIGDGRPIYETIR